MKTKHVNTKTLGTLFVGVGVSFGISYALQQPTPASAMELPAWAEKIPMVEQIVKPYKAIPKRMANQAYVAESEMQEAPKVSTIAANNTYTADQSDHFKTFHMKFVDENGRELTDNVSVGNQMAVGVGSSFDFTASNLKKGDEIIVPIQMQVADNRIDTSALRAGVGITDAGQRFKIIGATEKGLTVQATQDVTEAHGSFKIGARTGNARLGLVAQIKSDLSGWEVKPLDILYNGKQISHITSTVKPFMNSNAGITTNTDVQFSGNSMNDPLYLDGANTQDKDHMHKSAKEMGAEDVMQSATVTVKNDTITGLKNAVVSGWIAVPGSKMGEYYPPIAMQTVNGDTFNPDANRLNDMPEFGYKAIQMPDGLTENQVRDRLKAEMSKDKTKIYWGYSISKDGHSVALAVYTGNLFDKYQPLKLADLPYYKKIGATSPHDYFEKTTGGKYTPERAKQIDEYYAKPRLKFTLYPNFSVADAAIDHDAHVELHTSFGDKSQDFHGFGSEAKVEGQSFVKTHYVNADGKDISDVVTDAGWPKGSEQNKDGADKSTSHGKYLPGYVLTKIDNKTVNTPEDIKSDYPEDGKTTTVTYHYAKVGQFVTKEPDVKVPNYAVDKQNYTQIESNYTIPYVKGKKAQDVDGHDLKLMDPKDKTKGYHAPTIKSMFKDTRINYVADEGTVKIEYFDATANKVIQTDSETGIVDEKAKYTTDATIKKWVGQGYVLKSDHYPKGFTFVDGKPVYRVDFEQGTTKHTPSDPKGMAMDKLRKVVSQMIVYQNDKTKQPMTGLKDNKQVVVFDKEIVTNNVTHKVVSETAFKAQKPSYQAVNSPKVNGWVAKQLVVPAKENVAPTDGDTKIVVSYVQGDQKGTVTYVNDDRDGKVLAVDALVGKSGEKSTYTTKAQLEKLYALGYELVKDEYPEQGLTFDSDDTKDQNFVEHLGERKSPITPDKPGRPGQPFDPKYPDGVKWPEGTDALKLTKQRQIDYVFKGQENKNYSKTETCDLSRKGIVNHVTGETKYDDYGQVDKFKQVATPEVDGWTADKDAVDEVTIDEKTPELTREVVTYEKKPDEKPDQAEEKEAKPEVKKDKPEPQQGDTPEAEPKQAEQAAAEKPEEAKPKDVAANTGESTPLTDIWMAIQKLLHFDLGK